jgi:predicted metal-dependent enzyme (double-stranded beta helix superfamily)
VTNILDAFIAHSNRLPLTAAASPAVRSATLANLRALARAIALREADTIANDARYIARPIHRDPAGWSLAVIVFAPGQATLPHDHEAWGCATTIRGMERVRRFTNPTGHRLRMFAELDVPAGDGYLFDRDEIHQVIGADRRAPTVALHLLVQGTAADRANQHLPERLPPDYWRIPIPRRSAPYPRQYTRNGAAHL